jgi:hypothetical protein
MNKRRTSRPRPTFAQIAEQARLEVGFEYEARLSSDLAIALEQARAEYEEAYHLLSKHTTALELECAMLREQLRYAQRSWFKALVSRIKSPWA